MNEDIGLRRDGIAVLRGVFSRSEIVGARELVLANRALLRRTRPSRSSGHLASFHRFPALEPLHQLLTGNAQIRQLVASALGGEDVCTIGLSDITVNRSQQWHVDLLRGKYSEYLAGIDIWNPAAGGVFKVLVYLNDSDSLQVLPGSHLTPIALADDALAIPEPDTAIVPVPVHAGDVVVLDIRCVHRGSDEQTYLSGKWDEQPRILVSTVLGGVGRALTHALEAGNFARFVDWRARWENAGEPCQTLPEAQ